MTKAQIRAKLKKAIKAMDKAQEAMDELRRACEETNDAIYEYGMKQSKQDYLLMLLEIADLCGLDIEDTTICLQDCLDRI